MNPEANEQNLCFVVETFSPTTGSFLYTSFTIVDEDVMYFGQSNQRRPYVDFVTITDEIRPIPDNEIFPEMTAALSQQLTRTPDLPNIAPEAQAFFIKRPHPIQVEDYREGRRRFVVPYTFLEEARALELVSRYPHPNIIKYYGCRVLRDRITGLVFASKLDLYLQNKFCKDRHDRDGHDKDEFMIKLEAAVRHLHSHGLAHNDINPMNILWERGTGPLLTGFWACRQIGHPLPSHYRGTPGFVDEGDTFATSEESRDLFALGKIRAWLDNPNFTAWEGLLDCVRYQ